MRRPNLITLPAMRAVLKAKRTVLRGGMGIVSVELLEEAKVEVVTNLGRSGART